jgi:hypothetical protein
MDHTTVMLAAMLPGVLNNLEIPPKSNPKAVEQSLCQTKSSALLDER